MKLVQDFGIRALLGTIVVLGGVGTLGYLAIIKSSAEAQTALATMTSMIVAYYFGQRSNK